MVGGFNTNVRYRERTYHVQTEDGGVLRLRFDRLRRRWFVDGLYD